MAGAGAPMTQHKESALPRNSQTAGTGPDRRHLLRSGVAAILCTGALRPVAADAAPDMRSYRYRPALGRASPALDVYRPTGTDAAPVLVYVHGGAWAAGRRSAVHDMPAHFTALGYLFVSLDYRLLPDVRIEEQQQDIDHAVGWLRARAADLGGDAGRLWLMGHSAGAHLVSLATVAPACSAAASAGALRGVIANDTRAYDVPRIAAQARGGRLPALYENAFGTDPERWRRLSPLHQVGTAGPLPDFLLLYSGQGRGNTRADFARAFAAALRRAGAGVRLFDGSRYSHRQINTGIGTAPDITAAIDGFLQDTG